MDILNTIISLVDLYGKVSGILKGNSSKQVLDRIANNVERLSDKILYASNIQVVQHIDQQQQRSVDLRSVRQYLEPVQRAIGGEILSSAMIVTPDKMQVALGKNPWEVLDNIRPVSFAVPHANPDMVPVLFPHDNTEYIGWQLRGTLPMLFGCYYEDLWTPANSTLIIVDSRPLLGIEKGRVVQFSYTASKTVDDFLDEIYFSQRPHLPSYTYRTNWILRELTSGKVYWGIGTRWAEENGMERDTRLLLKANIRSGMKFEIVHPQE